MGHTFYCAEVVRHGSLGHGTYSFTLDSPVDAFDPNVVLGLFTWSDDPAYAHREIDIEFGTWGEGNGLAGQFVVQPWDPPGHRERFAMPSCVSSTHGFTWSPDLVAFRSVCGPDYRSPDPTLRVHTWEFCGAGVPVPGDETPRINRWLLGGTPPTTLQEVEVIVSRFVFDPL